jgi:hypothetical protein
MECRVQVGAGGAEISDLYPFLTELRAEVSRTEAAVATLIFETRRDEQGEWLVQDAGVLFPWQPIIISTTSGEEVMRGYIRQVNTDYPENAAAAKVTVECQDDSLRLDREHKRVAWGTNAPTSDTVILSTILTPYGLTPHPDNGQGESQVVDPQNETDVRYLKRRAETNDYELIFSEGQVYFGPMRLSSATQPTILVYAGASSNCLSFNAKADAHQPDSVAFDIPAASGNTSTEQIVQPTLQWLGPTHADSAASGLEDFKWKMSGQAGADQARLQALAQQKANDFDIHKIQAEGELDGMLYGHVLRAGLPVSVDGVGSWLGGTYYVDKVSHHFTFGGYRQRFTLLRNAYGDNLGSGSGSMLLQGVF